MTAVSPIEEKLRRHSVVAPSGCWIWLGGRSVGYGRVRLNGRRALAHRVSYELHVGPIPAGMQIDHLCRRRACIRPDHLQAVTPSTNTRRGTSPSARALRSLKCLRGHAYADHGFVSHGRHHCRECRALNSRQSRARHQAAS